MPSENNLKFVMRGIAKAKAATCFAMGRIAFRDEVVPIRPLASRMPKVYNQSVAWRKPGTPKGE